jgi:hypothetical protein
MIIAVEICLGMSTYIQTHWVTHLRVSRLSNMSLVLYQRKRETPKVGREVLECFHYITDGSGRVRNPGDDIMEVSEWKKVKPMYLWEL